MSPVACRNPSRTALPLPRGLVLEHQFDPGAMPILFRQFARTVGRITFHYNDLAIDGGELFFEQGIHENREGPAFIKCGDDDRAFGTCARLVTGGGDQQLTGVQFVYQYLVEPLPQQEQLDGRFVEEPPVAIPANRAVEL